MLESFGELGGDLPVAGSTVPGAFEVRAVLEEEAEEFRRVAWSEACVFSSLGGEIVFHTLMPYFCFQFLQIPNQQARAVECQQFQVTQIVQGGGHCLATGCGEVRDLLVGDKLPYHPFVPNALAFCLGQVHQKLNDAAAAVPKHQ